MSEQPNNGTLRLYWHPNLPAKDDPFYVNVNSAEEAVHLADALASYDGYLFTQKLREDYTNTGGLEVFKGDEWEDWKSSDGTPFDKYWSDYNKVTQEYKERPEDKRVVFNIEGKDILRLEEDGKIYVNGRLAEEDDDREVINALRRFLRYSGALVE